MIFTAFNDRETKNVPPAAILLYFVVMVLSFGLIPFVFGTRRWRKKVLADGKPATATIVSNDFMSGQNLAYINYVKRKLHIEPPGDRPFDFTTDEDESVYNLTVGAKVPVKYDPQNKKHVVLDISEYEQLTTQAQEVDSIAQIDAMAAQVAVAIAKRGPAAQANSAPASGGISAELANLVQMHKNGDLSDAKFESAKKKLLG